MSEIEALIFAQDYRTGEQLAQSLHLRDGTWRFIFDMADLLGRAPSIPVYVYFYRPMDMKQILIMKVLQTRFTNINYPDM